jgi:glc operon protein GlcG
MQKFRTALIAAAAAAALVTTGAVAASLDSLVIHGAPAKKIHEKYALSIDAAKKIAAACIAYAQQHNVAVSVAIMDPFGEMIYFERMDGQGKLNTSTALLKAKTALVTRASTHLVMNNVLQGNVDSFRAGYWNGEFANKGGLPIIAEDQFLGAIGVGGSNMDEECAQAGLEAVIGPQPPLVQNLPRRSAGAANGG